MGFIRFVIVTAVAVSVSLAVSGCATEDQPPAPSAGGGGRGAAAVPVTVAPVVTREMPIEISVIGTAEAFSNVGIRSQITGTASGSQFHRR